MAEINIKQLEKLSEEWLKVKTQRMQNLLKFAEPDEALYREIFLSLGYPKNKVNFLELALLLPYGEIRKLKDKETIQKALLYRAGFSDDKDGLPPSFDFSLRIDKSVWEYKGIRPANSPEKRIMGITDLLVKSIDSGLTQFFIKNIKANMIDSYNFSLIKKIMDFEGIGVQRKEEMFFNIIMPFLMIASDEEKLKEFLKNIYENYPALKDNSLTKRFKSKFPELEIKTAKTHMAVIFYMKNK